MASIKVTKEIASGWHGFVYNDWIKEIGIDFIEVEEGYIYAELVNQEKYHIRTGGTPGKLTGAAAGAMFGGILLTATDIIAFMAAFTTDTYVPKATITHTCSFLLPANAAVFGISAQVTSWGKAVSHVTTSVYNLETDEMVFQSQSTLSMRMVEAPAVG